MNNPDVALDIRKPNPARMYDYALGGKDSFAADREAAERLFRMSPDAKTAALDNRSFLRRAVAFCAASGVGQFLDIGSGLPTAQNTHEVAREIRSDARVVYVDNDPMVQAHAAALLSGSPGVAAISGDLQNPRDILANPAVQSLLDFSRPIAVVLVAILHFVPDKLCYEVVDYLKQAVPSGSCLVISHATADDATAAEVSEVEQVYDAAGVPIALRTEDQVSAFFNGFRLAEPGVVNMVAWRNPNTPHARRIIGYGGAAFKP